MGSKDVATRDKRGMSDRKIERSAEEQGHGQAFQDAEIRDWRESGRRE